MVDRGRFVADRRDIQGCGVATGLSVMLQLSDGFHHLIGARMAIDIGQVSFALE